MEWSYFIFLLIQYFNSQVNLSIRVQFFILIKYQLMLHNSHVIYEAQDARKKIKGNLSEQHCKINGSYFEAPLVEKTLSTKPHAWRHVFRCVVEQFLPGKQTKQDKKNTEHFLNQTPMQCTTMKLMNLEKISQSNPNILKAYRRHYRVDIKEYLKRKYQKQAYELPLQAFECLRLVGEKDKNKQYKTGCAYFFKPYYINDNLKKRMECSEKWSKKMFSPKNLGSLFKQFLKCSVQFGGLDNFIMTTSNLYVEENLETLQINHTSFAGLGVLKCRSSVGAHQYFQIIPYLTKRMLDTKEIGVQDRIRFFLINCLCAIEKKDFIKETSHTVEANHFFSYDDVQKVVNSGEIAKQFKDQIKNLVLKNKKKNQLDKYQIINLIEKGLVDQVQLSWHQIVQKIYIGPSQQKMIKLKSEGLSRNQANAIKVAEAFKKLHLQLYEEDPQKQFYKSRGLDSELLYIPVRFRIDFGEIFDCKAWWDIFNILNENNQANPNFFNFLLENFCFRLADAIIKRYDKQERNAEWTKRIRQDEALRYIFEYLNLSQISNLILPYEKNKQAIIFNETYQKYRTLVRQAGEETQNFTKILS